MATDDSLKKGVPLFGAAWVPSAAISEQDVLETPVKRFVVLSGGGGEGRTGISNALLLSAFDSDSNSLSDHPVARLGTGSDVPYRMGVHPGGESILCSFPKSCRWFEWDSNTDTDDHTLSLKPSETVLEPLEDVGQQLAVTFNNDGTLLAVGGDDGKLRVFKWPTMESILSEANAHSSVKDLDFSPDGKFLVSVGSDRGRIWGLESSSSVASLPKENDEIFGFCRFSRSTDTDQVLYITTNRDKGCGSIVKWNPTSWKRISSTFVSRHPVSALNVSPDGKLLAVGTSEGDVVIIHSGSMRRHTFYKKAHQGPFVDGAIVSASIDERSMATLIKDKKEDGMKWWVILLLLLLAVGLCYKGEGNGSYLPRPTPSKFI